MPSISVVIISKETLFSLFNCLFLFSYFEYVHWLVYFFPLKWMIAEYFLNFTCKKFCSADFCVDFSWGGSISAYSARQGFNSFLRLSFYNYFIKGQYLKLQHFHCLFSLQQWLHLLCCLSCLLLFTGISFLPVCTINSSGLKSLNVEFR